MKHSADDASALPSLWMYRTLDRFHRLSYSGKIMFVSFAGTHIPLIALIAYIGVTSASDMDYALKMVGVALVATLVGTTLSLIMLHHLLRPIVLTSKGLRNYIVDRTLPDLPSGFHDAAGTLMGDADFALRRLDETIDYLEHYDPASALPNRAHFLRLLAERIKNADERPLAVCVLSIERLDHITTTFGQEHGDSYLRQCVRQLQLTLEHHDALSRLDTRTFALMLETDDLDAIRATLEALDRSLSEIYHDQIDVRLGCRSGISLCPLDGCDAQGLLDDAMSALDMTAREQSRFAFFSSASRDALVESHALERDLRRALDNDDELTMHYQPIIEGETIIGAEALIRWQHPSHGMVSPEAFIPLAEESDLIELIGRWTLRTACRQIAIWREQGIRDQKIAVNLSARQFNDPTLLTYLDETLREFAIRPGTLELEVTETSAMSDAAHASTIMSKVRDLGVSIAIDDFGTGYSSMSYLRTMPFNKLKIDREFVQDIASNADRQAICRTLIALAHELKLEVLAEGTETLSEVTMLREQGCNLFQGFYFHKPMPAEELATLLKREFVLPCSHAT
ncbi:putative bifunctional diguanylate cyclase/phosphodiesterase [Granulosicoccus antarcticus]|uniref:cyclic-guanylate-specific phosphodiesterase n=1 Tax=Granulosicoccus antarcticus IMCC3135 TaxID=1192854 RepID=A0A2Z2NK63_9GAMM|nr:bifunctional diguanylate cyclase/phosphodiesterase [Granulosicoccus antarcticus]ASJ71569.1 Cyclic di-GMP phosphodiesterase Gmr [Granulosicoccus antarcticus IMCC3135]